MLLVLSSYYHISSYFHVIERNCTTKFRKEIKSKRPIAAINSKKRKRIGMRKCWNKFKFNLQPESEKETS